MLIIISKTLQKNWKRTLIYIISIAFMICLYLSLFPAIQKQSAQLEQLMATYPDALKKAFNFDQAAFTTFESFLTVETFSFMWPILITSLIVYLGATSFAGEIEDRTIGLLLSLPISRAHLYWGKYIAGAIIIVLTCAAVFLTIPLAAVLNIPIQPLSYISIFVLSSLFALSVYSFSILLSSRFSSGGIVVSVTSSVVLAMYFINLLSQLETSLEKLKYVSIFNYFQYSDALVKNELHIESVAIFLTIIVFCSLFGYFIFAKRDISL